MHIWLRDAFFFNKALFKSLLFSQSGVAYTKKTNTLNYSETHSHLILIRYMAYVGVKVIKIERIAR